MSDASDALAPSTKFVQNPSRTWPIRAIAMLLLLQVIGMLYISYDLLIQHDWGFIQEVVVDVNDPPTAAELGVTTAQLEAIETTLTFSPSVLLALLAALGFLFLLRLGWVLAMMTQGLILWACLSLYFNRQPTFVYPLMLSCILMVLYLNAFQVRAVFQPPASPRLGDEDAP